MNILYFHDIRPFDPYFFPERYKKHSFITDKQFINIINNLENRINHPKEIKKFFSKKYVSKDIILSFDDGLKDHLWVANYLYKKGISAIFFIPFGIIKNKTFIHSHLIQFLIASGYSKEIEKYIYNFLLKTEGLEKKQIKNYYTSRWKNNIWTKEEIFITRTLRESLNINLREKIIRILVEKYLLIDFKDLHNNFYLNFQDIKEIKKLGHFIGSHGYFSHDLRFLNIKSIYEELKRSFFFLKKFTNKDCRFISYPNGGCNDQIKKIAQKIGYEFGFSTHYYHISMKSDLLNLPRLDGTKFIYC